MAYKILTKNGIENTNIDGARENFFNTGMRDGIVKGSFNEGKFESNSSNSIYLDTCELKISGHRIVIDEPVYKTFSNIPSKNTRYSMIAQITVSDTKDVAFSLFVQSVETVLIKDNLYATTTGQGTYQVEIGRFTLTTNGTVEDVVRTIDIITGGTGSGNGGSINIGNVTTQKIDYNLDAEVDVNQRYDSEQKKTFTDFNFQLPTQYPIDLDQVSKDVQDAKLKATEAVNTANNANTNAQNAQNTAETANANAQNAQSTADNAVSKNTEQDTEINTIKNQLLNKQDALTFDTTPTENSNNPVTSGGIFNALAIKEGVVEYGTGTRSWYIRFVNGFQICWGYENNLTNNGQVTFPKPFTTARVMITQRGVTSSWNDNMKVNGNETTSFTVNMGGTTNIEWIAVGLWK